MLRFVALLAWLLLVGGVMTGTGYYAMPFIFDHYQTGLQRFLAASTFNALLVLILLMFKPVVFQDGILVTVRDRRAALNEEANAIDVEAQRQTGAPSIGHIQAVFCCRSAGSLERDGMQLI